MSFPKTDALIRLKSKLKTYPLPHKQPGPTPSPASPAQFVLLIAHSVKNVMQCKEILYNVTIQAMS